VTDSDVNLIEESVSSITSGLLRRAQHHDQAAHARLKKKLNKCVFEKKEIQSLKGSGFLF
jgi:hypothetical protein